MANLGAMETGAEAPQDPGTPSAVIPARSERQAMDWSLVLTSQGIEVIPEAGEVDGPEWRLRVPEADRERALGLIRQWRAENRGWHWRREIPASRLEFHAGALLWVFALAVVHAARPLFAPGGTWDTRLARGGEWWRAFTAVWLHADAGHLASNATIGAVVLGLAMGRYGAGIALLLGLLSGAAGNVLGLLVRGQDYLGVGASGLVMGVIGLLGAQSVALWRLSWRATRYVLPALLGALFLFVLLGTDVRSDFLAHLGGFAAGIALGGLASLIPAPALPTANRIATALAGLLVVGTWIAALAR